MTELEGGRAAALVGISHGTSSEEGRAAVRRLHEGVAAAAARVAAGEAEPDGPRATGPVVLGHVDVEQPDPASSLASLPDGVDAVVVPYLLSAGYHVHVDLTDAVDEARAAGRRVSLAPPLGPDDALVAVLERRLREAGLADGDAIVLGVAGSSDARANDACRDVRDRLAARLGRDVSIGFLAAEEPRLPDAVAAARASLGSPERVVVANYLLAPGYFDDLARRAGADVVAQPLLVPHEPAPAELVDLALRRFAEAPRPA